MDCSTPCSQKSNNSSGVDCMCGSDCQCMATETLCRCEASSVLNSLQPLMKAHYTIQGMTCQSCVKTVSAILKSDTVVIGKATAEVHSHNQALQLVQELEDVGFDATLDCVEEEKQNTPSSHKSPRMRPMSFPRSPPSNHESSESPLFENEQSLQDPLLLDTSTEEEEEEVIEMAVGGMTCTMCSSAITRALQDSRGVVQVAVNLTTNTATIRYLPTLTNPATLKETIESVGYTVEEIVDDNVQHRMQDLARRQQEEVWMRKQAFLYSLVGTLPIFCMTMILPHILPTNVTEWLNRPLSMFSKQIQREALLLWILATPVQFGSGWTFYKGAYHNVRLKSLGMDVLVALGTTASYCYAVSEVLQGRSGHFFETSAVLLSFVLLGKWMNSLAVRRTSDALTKLMNLQSKQAIRITAKAQDASTENWDPTKDPYDEEVVDIRLVQPNDTVKVLRGASIPADGVVSHGAMTVDESMITGESIPVLKLPESIVLGGTVCVEAQQAAAFVHVTGVGSSTALAQIVQLVQDAQTRQVPIQNLADTISSFFVPTVCALSLITYMVWYALCSTGVVPQEWFQDEGAVTFSLMFGIACLVISCPCALGLATPTAVMVGTGVGASNGVLIKGGDTLEKAASVNSVVFDKTGTLTKGKPCVTDFVMLPENSFKASHLLWLLASLERNSEHPLATAVVKYAEDALASGEYLAFHPLEHPSSFRALTGRGASGIIDKVEVAVGNRPFAENMGIGIPDHVEEQMIELEQEGKTAILAAVDGSVCVVMGIADELKPDAAESIEYLRDTLKVDVWMVTGDNARTARAISQRLGLSPDRVISEALPVAKVHQVKKLQKEGKVVAMIGDGINDSPALAQADVGMSLGTGAEIAAEASDMVLVKGHVSDVCTALDLSRVIVRKIQWNFVWSLLYNCLGIPIAAGVFYPFVHTRLPPTLAALAMALSSLSVVGNSLALRLYKPPKMSSEEQSPAMEQPRRRLRGVNDSENDLTESLLVNDHLVSETNEGDAQAQSLEEGTMTNGT